MSQDPDITTDYVPLTVDQNRHAEIMDLRKRLQEAVQAEAFEEAARLRDLLREKEATDESG